MGDEGDYWRDVKSHFRKQKEKKGVALEKFGYDLLRRSMYELGLVIDEDDNFPPKWRVSNEKGDWIDYWPSTGTLYQPIKKIREYCGDWKKVAEKINSLLNK